MSKPSIVFVHTPCIELDNDRLEPPLGILYLATILREAGYDCHLCDLSGIDKDRWENQIAEGDVYAFSTYSVTYHQTLELKEMMRKRNRHALMIAGGPHVSALPQESIRDFDVIITGEAENTLQKVLHSYQAGIEVRGIWNGEPVTDLDSLPFPDLDLSDLQSYNRVVEGSKSISLVSSRGCPYNCTFCNSRVLSRGKLRFRSPENVVEEITLKKDKYGITNFRFNDDLFTFNPQRVRQMTEAIGPLDIKYRVFARSSSMTPEASGSLYQSGCRHVAIGFESGSAKMLSLLKKKTTVSENIAALVNAKAAGLKTRIYLLVGFPGETEETVRETIDVLRNVEFDEFVVYPFIPYPGTAIWQYPEMWGASIDRDYSKYVQVGKDRSSCFAVTTADFTPDDVRRWRNMMIDEIESNAGAWAGQSVQNR